MGCNIFTVGLAMSLIVCLEMQLKFNLLVFVNLPWKCCVRRRNKFLNFVGNTGFFLVFIFRLGKFALYANTSTFLTDYRYISVSCLVLTS